MEPVTYLVNYSKRKIRIRKNILGEFSMKYSNLTIVLDLLTPYETTLFHQYRKQSGARGSLRDEIEDWFTHGGFQDVFEVNHHAAYQHALSSI